VKAWISDATIVIIRPAIGPYANPPIRIGMSAGSYSKSGTAGKIGK
jgi:hypothetical protein